MRGDRCGCLGSARRGGTRAPRAPGDADRPLRPAQCACRHRRDRPGCGDWPTLIRCGCGRRSVVSTRCAASAERAGTPVFLTRGLLWRDDESLPAVMSTLDALGVALHERGSRRRGSVLPGSVQRREGCSLAAGGRRRAGRRIAAGSAEDLPERLRCNASRTGCGRVWRDLPMASGWYWPRAT